MNKINAQQPALIISMMKPGCWFFSREENKLIPNVWYVVYSYLKRLSDMKVISYADNQRKLYKVITDFKTIEMELKEYAKNLATEEKKINRLNVMSRDDLNAMKAARIKAIVTSERELKENHDGHGQRCEQCFFVTSNEFSECQYCGSEDTSPCTITIEHLNIAEKKYKSNPAIKRSCLNLSLED